MLWCDCRHQSGCASDIQIRTRGITYRGICGRVLWQPATAASTTRCINLTQADYATRRRRSSECSTRERCEPRQFCTACSRDGWFAAERCASSYDIRTSSTADASTTDSCIADCRRYLAYILAAEHRHTNCKDFTKSNPTETTDQFYSSPRCTSH